MSNVLEAIANVKARGTAHHAHNADRTVAFRMTDNGRFNLTFNNGATANNATEEAAAELATAYLNPVAPKPATPAKRASIALGRGWSISLRRDEVFPDNPGEGMPVVVCGPFGASVSLPAAMDGAEAENGRGEEVEIPAHVRRAMDKAEPEVEAWHKEVEAWLARKG